MSESAFLIPSDWDGETWECIQVQWPASDEWRVMFRSLLYLMTRGRTWDAGSGVIIDAQADAWAVYDRNFPLIMCADCNGVTDDDDAPPCETCGGGLVVMEGEDMGQVVTDVWIDYDTSQLVVEFGKCCPKRFYFPLSTLGSFEQPDEDLPGEPDYPEGTDDYTACAKATAIWEVWVGAVDVILDAASGITMPWNVVGQLKAAYPSVNWGSLSVLNAYTAAISVETQGFASEVETPAWMAEVKQLWATIGGDDGLGWTEDQYKQAQSFVNSVGSKHFNVLDFASAFGSMLSVWFYTFQAIGAGDANDLTTRIVPTGDEDCDYSADDVGWPTEQEPSALGYYVGDVIVETIVGGSSGGGAVEKQEEWEAAHDIYGVVFDVFHNVSPWDGEGTLKRMALVDAPGVVSFFQDTSDHLEDDATGKWVFSTDEIRKELAADQWRDVNPAVGTPEVPLITQGEDVGIHFHFHATELHTFEFTNMRPIYNVNSPSHD